MIRFTENRCSSQEWGLTYNAGLLATVTRAPAGGDAQHKVTYRRDLFGNVRQVTEEAGGEPARVTLVDYDSDNIFPNTVTNAEGHVTQLRFDPHWGEPTAIVDANGIAVQTVYDDFGRAAETSGPDGTSVSTYSGIAAPNGITAIGAIQPRFQVTLEREGTAGTRSGASVTEYDIYGRAVRSSTESFGGSEVIQEQVYDGLGRLSGVTLPHTADLNIVPYDHYTYDSLQRLARVDHSDKTFREFQHASSASIVPKFQQWFAGSTVGCGPHLMSLGVCAVEAELTIDEEGHRNAVVTDYRGLTLRNIDGDNIDSLAHTSNYEYGALYSLVEAHDNRDFVTGFEYDDYGRLLSQTDPDSGKTLYTYNGFDELKTSKDPKAQLRTYHHDSLGRMDNVVDPLGTTQWIYDQGENALGRISETISPATPESPNGQHIRYVYESPTTTGNRGFLQTATYAIDGTDYPIGIEYDDLGRTDRVHYPSLGNAAPVVAKYLYDTSGALKGLDEVGSGTAQPLWRLSAVFQGYLVQHETFGNGAETTYGYEPNRRFLEKIQTTLGGGQIQSLDYTHYNNGLVHTLNAAGAAPREYIYDNLNRLSFAVDKPTPGAPVATPYSYDDIGNLVGRGATVTAYRTAQPHFIDTVGANTYQYDGNGNVSSRSGPDIPGGNQIFNYTPFDLPSSVTTGGISPFDPNTKTVRFDYSADEERLARRDPDSTRHFVADLYQREFDSADITLEERFRLYAGDRQLGEIVRKDGADRTLYFHADHLGSPNTISDSGGTSFDQHFDPFGAPVDAPNSAVTRVGFTGQDQDVDLGLTDMKGRIYDPLAGRFTGADPVMQAPTWSQGLNRYSYVFNDPVNNTDPSGFESTAAWAGGAAFTAADLGLLCYGTGCFDGLALSGGTVGSGLGFGALNIGFSLLTDQYDVFNGSSGGTYVGRAPSAAPKSSGVNPRAPGAGVENKGGIGASYPVVQQKAAGPFMVPNDGGMCQFYECLAENGRFGGAGSSGTWGPSDDIGPPNSAEQLQRLSELLQVARQHVQQQLPRVKLDNNLQLGKKIGKHARDFGLDPANPAHRQFVINRIRQITENWDEVRQGPWHPGSGGGSDYLFFRQSKDVVVTKSTGDFVTILKGGLNNGWFRAAKPLL